VQIILSFESELLLKLDGVTDMQETQCRHCGSCEVRVKEIEIRHINSHTMALNAKEKVRELECQRCGWVASLSQDSFSKSLSGALLV
jgi:ribosomal protein L40E